MARRILLLGTGTNVGKTHVACALLAALRLRGVPAAALKPIASGVSDGLGEDALRHAAALEVAPRPPLFAYTRAVSPHLAARTEGHEVRLEPIASEVERVGREVDVLVIESVGGLFSPLGPGLSSVDLAKSIAPADLVVVSADRLGVLHHLSACAIAAKACGLPPLRMVLSAPSVPDASTGCNAEEATQLGIAEVLATFPRARSTTFESLAAADRVLTALGV